MRYTIAVLQSAIENRMAHWYVFECKNSAHVLALPQSILFGQLLRGIVVLSSPPSSAVMVVGHK